MRVEIEKRLLVVACIGLILGIAAKTVVWNLALLLPLLWFLRPPAAKATLALACLVGVVIAPTPHVAPVEHGEFFKGSVRVETVPRPTRAGVACEVDGNGRRMVLQTRGPAEIGLGDRIEVVGVIEPPSETEGRSFQGRGLVGRLYPAQMRTTSEGPAVHRLGARWRNGFLAMTERTLSPRARASVDALCFNVDADLDQDFKRNLSRTGTIHIISASGMHVVIFAFALQWLLGRLPVPRWVQLLILGAILFFYASAAGLRPPVVRSVVMSMIVLSAFVFRREADWLSAMAAGALGYLLFSPASLLDAGFQLSFAAVASLCMFGRYWGPGPLNGLKTAAHTSLVASVGTAPLVAYHFGMFSIAAIAANLLIGAVIAPIVTISLLCLVIDAFLPALSTGLMKCAVEPLTGWLMWVVDTMGPWRLSAVDAPAFSAFWLLPIYAAILVLWRRRPVET